MDIISKKELIFFKNEILEDFKKLENKLNEKILTINQEIQTFMSQSDLKLEAFQAKSLEILSNKIEQKDTSYLNSFEKKIENLIHSNETDIKNLEKDYINSCNKYDSIIKNNLNFPGLIGNSCKFDTLRIFIEYINKTIKELLDNKKLINGELKIYRDKINSVSANVKIQLMGIENRFKNFNFNSVKNFDNLFQEKLDNFDIKINNIKLNNEKNSLDIIQKYDELNSKFEIINKFQNNIKNIFEEDLKKYKEEINNEFNYQKEEIKNIKKNFKNLDDIKKEINYLKRNSKYNNYYKINNNIQEFEKNNYNYKINKPVNQIIKEKENNIETKMPELKNRNRNDNKKNKNNISKIIKSLSSDNLMNKDTETNIIKENTVNFNNNLNQQNFLKTENLFINNQIKNIPNINLNNIRYNNNKRYIYIDNSNNLIKGELIKNSKNPKISSYITSKYKLQFEKLESLENNKNFFGAKSQILNMREDNEKEKNLKNKEEEKDRDKNISFNHYIKLFSEKDFLNDKEIISLNINLFKLLNTKVMTLNKNTKNSFLNINKKIEKLLKLLDFLLDICQKEKKLQFSDNFKKNFYSPEQTKYYKDNLLTFSSGNNKSKNKKYNFPNIDMIINLMKKTIKNKKNYS